MAKAVILNVHWRCMAEKGRAARNATAPSGAFALPTVPRIFARNANLDRVLKDLGPAISDRLRLCI